jgi:hypothetical protein
VGLKQGKGIKGRTPLFFAFLLLPMIAKWFEYRRGFKKDIKFNLKQFLAKISELVFQSSKKETLHFLSKTPRHITLMRISL